MFKRVPWSFSSLSDWLTVGFWLLTPGGPEVSTGLFFIPTIPFPASQITELWLQAWLGVLICYHYRCIYSIASGACGCMCVCACALSDAFSLFACVHMVDVCVWKERRCKIDEGGINVCVCTCGRLQGGSCVRTWIRLCVFLCICLWFVSILQG